MDNINVRDYGAAGDDIADDRQAIDAAHACAVASHGVLFFPPGTYKYNGKISLDSGNGETWEGCGSANSIIHFTDPTVSACVERIQKQGANMSISGLTIRGPGKASGVGVHGFYSSYMTGAAQNSYSYNLRMVDVAVCDVSGTGFYVTDWFQQYWNGCYAREIGGDGFVISGDQAVTFIGAGSYNLNIAGWSWWFQGGNPFLQNLNCGNVGSGLRLGRDATHSAGAAYCFPTILGCNIEPCLTGGTGLLFEIGSNIAFGTGIQVYAISTVVAHGAVFRYITNTGILATPIQFNVSAGGSFSEKLDAHAYTGGGLIVLGESQDGVSTVAGKLATAGLYVSNGYLVIPDRKLKTNGLRLNGVLESNHRTVTARTTIMRDYGPQNDSILMCDASLAPFTVNIDYPSYLADRLLTIKKIDASANPITIAPSGGQIDGAPSCILSKPNQSVALFSDGVSWRVLYCN